MNSVSFFLGANTPSGFYSLFDELYDPEGDWAMYIIKGGPGTGKSSLMKKVASEAEKIGYVIERIYCSSDPSSLDAVIIPELKISIADGTSPHTIEPIYPAVCEQLVDLGSCWNKDKLKANTKQIKSISKENSDFHKKNVKYLKAASIVDKEIKLLTDSILNKEKASRFTIRFAEKYIRQTDTDSNSVKKRFISAVTPVGIAVQYDSLFNMCDEIITIKDKTGSVSDYIIRFIDAIADKNGIDRILCMCPMNPDNKIEHIIFPNLRVGIFTSNSYHPMIKKNLRAVRSERFLNQDAYDTIKNKITFLNKAKMELIGESVKCLEQAKATHDMLESYYISSMNFSSVSEIRENLIKEMFHVKH